jgi:Protein of unknown function (DUF2726)
MNLLRSFWNWLTAPSGPATIMPYSRRPVLTAAELKFYRVLLLIRPQGLVLLAKVRLLDLVQVRNGDWTIHGAPASGKHVDFVFADSQAMDTVLLLELDDRSHLRADRQRRDEFVDGVLTAAGIPGLRVPAAWRYDQRSLRASTRGGFSGRRRDSAARICYDAFAARIDDKCEDGSGRPKERDTAVHARPVTTGDECDRKPFATSFGGSPPCSPFHSPTPPSTSRASPRAAAARTPDHPGRDT